MKKPNTAQTILSVASCKLTRAILRKTGRGGTAIPGIVAMKAAKNILAAVSEGMEIVVVTGTNGKTTSCNMIEHALTSGGHECLLNKSGANMLHGMAADLIAAADWLGKPQYPYAVLERDEAALKLVVPVFEGMTEWTFDSVHDALIGLAAANELKNGRIMWPVRVAVSGKPTTPGGAVELCHILGKEETLRRIQKGIEQLTPKA